MKKGIVLAMDHNFVTLLTSEGEFERVCKDSRMYDIGDEILFIPNSQKKKTVTVWTSKTLFTLAAAVILFLFSFIPGSFNDTASAYVTIDINPSIEMGLDDHLRVVRLIGLNEEGKRLLMKINNWKGKDLKTGTLTIVKEMKNQGYYRGNKPIVVSATILDDNKSLEDRMEKKLKQISSQQVIPEAEVKVLKATVKERNKAREKGISTGKYLQDKQRTKESVPGKAKKKDHIQKADSATKSAGQSHNLKTTEPEQIRNKEIINKQIKNKDKQNKSKQINTSAASQAHTQPERRKKASAPVGNTAKNVTKAAKIMDPQKRSGKIHNQSTKTGEKDQLKRPKPAEMQRRGIRHGPHSENSRGKGPENGRQQKRHAPPKHPNPNYDKKINTGTYPSPKHGTEEKKTAGRPNPIEKPEP